MLCRSIIVLTVFLAKATVALSADWIVDPERSRLTFQSDQFGKPFTGSFPEYDARIRFDPHDLAQTDVSVAIDITSIQTGDDQRDGSIAGREWFSSAEYPVARFRSERAHHLGGSRYALDGRLSIKGSEQPATIEFELAIQENSAHVIGTMTVLRSDFGIGEGQFALPQVATDEVVVNIDLFASALEE